MRVLKVLGDAAVSDWAPFNGMLNVAGAMPSLRFICYVGGWYEGARAIRLVMLLLMDRGIIELAIISLRCCWRDRNEMSELDLVSLTV